MENVFDSEYNKIAKSSMDSPLLFFSENSIIEEYEEQNIFTYNYIDDEGQKKSNIIEENQNLYQNESSEKTQGKEKEKENIKYDEKPIIEISKINYNENGNSDTEKEKNIDNVNYKIDNKEKTQEKKEPDYRFSNFITKIKVFLFKVLVIYVNSFIKGPKLLNIENEVVRNTESEFNKDLLKKRLKIILSGSISIKYTKIKNKQINKEIIEKIYEEKNQNVILDILNMNLEDFIKNFKSNPILKKYYDKKIGKMKKEYSDNYIRTFEYYFDNYCEICDKRKIKKK